MEAQIGNAAEVLGELSASLNKMLQLLQTMVATIRPPSANTLPIVTATLSGITEITEHAATQVLDEAEAIQDDQVRLAKALDRLGSALAPNDAEAQATWKEAIDCSTALSARALKLMAAMEFQDLTAQHIDKTLGSIEDVRERLRAVLSLFDLQQGPAPAPEPEVISPIRQAAHPNRSGQALADQLLAELS